MKKILLCLVVLAGVARAQTAAPIQSFMGVPFETASAGAIQAMTAAKATFIANKSKKGNFVFNDAAYGGFKTDYVYLKFSNDKFYEGGAYFVSDRDKAQKLYLELRHLVSSTYGEGTDKGTVTDFSQVSAVENGEATLKTVWVEDPSNNKKNSIELTLEPDLSVLLKFIENKASRKNQVSF